MKRTEKLQLMLSSEELQLIDDWRFENHLPSRAAALRELIGRSINSEVSELDRTASTRDIGVLSSPLSRQGMPSFSIADATQDDFPLIYISDGFTELCEYEPDEVIGRNCRFLQGPKTSKQSTQKIRSALANGEGCEVEITNYRKSGSSYLIKLKIEPLFTDNSKAPRFYVGTQMLLDGPHT